MEQNGQVRKRGDLTARPAVEKDHLLSRCSWVDFRTLYQGEVELTMIADFDGVLGGLDFQATVALVFVADDIDTSTQLHWVVTLRADQHFYFPFILKMGVTVGRIVFIMAEHLGHSAL